MTREEVQFAEGRDLDAIVDAVIFRHAVKFCKGEPTGWAVTRTTDGLGKVTSETRVPMVWEPNDYIRTHAKVLTTIPWYHKNWNCMDELLKELERRSFEWKIQGPSPKDRAYTVLIHKGDKWYGLARSLIVPTAAAKAALFAVIAKEEEDDFERIRPA